MSTTNLDEQVRSAIENLESDRNLSWSVFLKGGPAPTVVWLEAVGDHIAADLEATPEADLATMLRANPGRYFRVTDAAVIALCERQDLPPFFLKAVRSHLEKTIWTSDLAGLRQAVAKLLQALSILELASPAPSFLDSNFTLNPNLKSVLEEVKRPEYRPSTFSSGRSKPDPAMC